jgi:hypothetical protein
MSGLRHLTVTAASFYGCRGVIFSLLWRHPSAAAASRSGAMLGSGLNP